MTRAFMRERRRFLARAAGAAGAAAARRLQQAFADRMVSEDPRRRRTGQRRGGGAGDPAPRDGAGVHAGGPVAAVSQQRDVRSRESGVSGTGRAGLRQLPAGDRRPRRTAHVVLARRIARAAGAHADHAPRLRGRLERDREVEGREARGHPRCGAPEAGRAVRDVLLRRSDGGRTAPTSTTKASTWTMRGIRRRSSPTR